MTYRFYDLVQVINQTTSPFELANDMAVFQQGLSDLLTRIRALEAAVAHERSQEGAE